MRLLSERRHKDCVCYPEGLATGLCSRSLELRNGNGPACKYGKARIQPPRCPVCKRVSKTGKRCQSCAAKERARKSNGRF